MQEKQGCMILFFSIFQSFPLGVRFLLLLKYLLWEKYCNYPLTATHDDRFASCENIASLPPAPPACSKLRHFCFKSHHFHSIYNMNKPSTISKWL